MNENAKEAYGEQLFEAVTCGIVYYSTEERPRILKCNSACAQIYGYPSKEAFLQEDTSDVLTRMVYTYDMEFLKGSLRRAVQTGQTVNFGHRILRNDQTIGYIMGTLKLVMLEDGTRVIRGIFNDSGQRIMQADIQKSIYYQSVEASTHTRKIILADADTVSRRELCGALQDTYTIIEVDNTGEVLSVLKKEEENVSAVLISADMLADQDYRFLAALRGSILYATIPILALAPRSISTEELLSRGVNEVLHQPYNMNVISLRLTNLIELRDTAVQRNTIEALMNNLSGGVMVCRIRSGRFAPLYFTEGIASLSGVSRQEMETMVNRGRWQEVVYEKDVERLQASVRKAIDSEDAIEVTFRVNHRGGGLAWVHMHGTQIRSGKDERIYQCILSPTSASEKMYMDIMNDSFNAIVVYGEHKDDLLYFNNAAVPLLEENMQEVFEGEDFPENHYVKKQLLLAGSRKHITLNAKKIDWNGIAAKIIYATDGTDSYRIQMERHQLYEMEMSKIDNLSDNVLFSAIFNINKDELVEFGADSLLELPIDRSYTIADCAQSISARVINQAQAEEFCREFSAHRFLERYQSGKTKQTVQCRIRRKDGGFQWIAISWALVENPATLELYAFLYVYDIDWDVVRQDSFAKILGFEEEYVACLDLISQNMRLMQLAEDTHIVDSGKVSREEFRCGAWKDSISEKEEELLCTQTSIEYIREQLEKEAIYCYYYQSRDAQGRRRRKKVRVFYLDDTRDILCFTRTDITDFHEEQQRQNEQLQAALHEAEQANKAKSMFLSRMSHDIRTPMNAILGMSRLALERLGEQSTVQNYLEKILSSGSYLLGLINDILDMSRIESDRVELDPEPYSIKKCVEFVLVSLDTQIAERHLDFQYREMGPMPEYVMLDKMRIQQVFFNLLSNAVKFAKEEGHVQVIVEPGAYDADGTLQTLVRVKDDGIGISKEDQEKIFEPFEQGGNQGDVRQQGSGLGLAIVKNLVRLMGGSISLESEPGRGSVFTLVLKLVPAKEADVLQENEKESAPREYDFTGVHVLLVEDNSINMEIARNMLEYRKCRVTGASNGKEAIEKLEASAPGEYRAVLMDMRMPVMDGLQAARRIRAHARKDLAGIPMIAMTANAFEEDFRKSREAGMNAHIVKPVDTGILYETLYRVLNQEDRGEEQWR